MSPESAAVSRSDFDPFIDAIVNARLRGYLRAMKEYGESPISVKFGVEALDIPEVTGVYCSRSLGAADLLGVCYDRGVRVPDRLSIVAQGNDREKKVVRPRLTTIDVRAKEMGVHAARTVLDIIDGKRPENVVLEPELIVQESTRAVA